MRAGKLAIGVAIAATVAGYLVPRVTASAAGTLTASWSHTVTTGPGSAPPSTVSGEPFAGTVVADLFGDGRKEIVAGFPDGSVWVFDATTGAVLPGWPRYLGGAMHTSPSVADLSNDGREEIIATSERGYIYVWNGDGSLYPGWPQHTTPPASNVLPGLFGGVAVGDLFGDGQKELVADAWDQHLYAWNRFGGLLPGFPIHVYDTSWDTPTLVDLEHRGQLDILAGFDSSGPPWDPFPKGGEMWAFRPTGCPTNMYPDQSHCAIPGWPRTFDEVPWASSAAADLFNNGSIEVVEGTGLNFPPPAGEYLNAWTSSGQTYGHWPQATGSQNLSSPAIGDLFGTGQRDIVQASDNGELFAYDGNGNWLPGWPVNLNNTYMHAYPTIGPISATQNGVWILNGSTLEGFNNAGQVVWTASGLDWGGFAAPTIGDLGDGQPSVVTLDQATSGRNAWTVRAFPIPGTTRMLPGAWPTFHGNAQESGTLVPTATMNAMAATQSTTQATVSWTLDTNSVPATQYNVWVRDTSGSAWQLYGHTASTSLQFFGLPGHHYQFTVQAENRSGGQDVGFSTNVVSTSFAAGASWATPFKEMYGVDGHGNLYPVSSAPERSSMTWPSWEIVRGVALEPSGLGGYVLDGFGGLHPFGDAPAVSATFYASGWDIARGVALRPDGHSGYVLDGWGGVHPFGTSGDMPPSVVSSVWWPGWDIARDIQLRGDGTSGYILDGFGGVHPFGSSGDTPPQVRTTAYWLGWDIVRRLTLDSNGDGGYLLDGFGGVHPFGTASGEPPATTITAYWPGWDVARGLALIPGSSAQGYVIDGYGGIHSFGGAPAAVAPNYNPGGDLRGLGIS